MGNSHLTVAVDLTPILPGGENGGAKIFVLTLLRRLAALYQDTTFLLLTQAASHDELKFLDNHNVQRHMVIGPAASTVLRPFILRLASIVLARLPARLRNKISQYGCRLNSVLKRNSSRALLHRLGADLLFCPFTAPTYYEQGVPTVCTVYDLQYRTYPEFFTVQDAMHRNHVFMDACRRATVLTAISDYSRTAAINHGNLEATRIRTIHLRMAQRISAPIEEQTDRVLARLVLSKHRYLVYPANFWKHKNHEMLLTAFGMACHGGLPEDIKLVCTGAPSERQDWLRNAAHTMKLGNRVVFAGYLPNSDLSVLIHNCGGMIFPSLYEGFGLPVIEAMAAGVPVACSNTTSLPEVAADAAILFDPRVPTQIALAMNSLFTDEMLREKLIQAGRQRADEFSDSDRMAREYWEIFQYALANERQENQLTGAYADGWAGPALSIQIAPDTVARSLEIEFSAPDWLPLPKLDVQTMKNGKPLGRSLVVARGAKALWSTPLEPAGGICEFRISPTFVPSRTGHGDDQRELSAMIQRCTIVRVGGDYIELLPRQVNS